MVYTYLAAVLVTRGFTGPDRYRTIRGIKLIWVLCSVQWIPQTTQAPHPPDYRERGPFTTDGMAVILSNPGFHYRKPGFLRLKIARCNATKYEISVK